MKQALKMMSVGAIALVMMLGFAACCEEQKPVTYKGGAELVATNGTQTFSTGATLTKVGDWQYEITGTIAKANQTAIDAWQVDGSVAGDGNDEYLLCIKLPNVTDVEIDMTKFKVTLKAQYYIANVDKNCTTNGISESVAGNAFADKDDWHGWVIGLDDALATDAVATDKVFEAIYDYDGDGTADASYKFTVKATAATVA